MDQINTERIECNENFNDLIEFESKDCLQNKIKYQVKILMQSEDPKPQEKIFKPRKIDFPQQYLFVRKSKIYASANRSYAVFQGEVVSWGDVIFQTSADKNGQNQHKNAIVIPIQVSELALGAKHTFAYEKSNQTQKQVSVFCWGSNKNYELGLQEEKLYGLEKVDIFDEAFEAGFILKEISCGDNHTLVVFKDEETAQTKLFGWGESKSYQLALDTTGIIPYPVQIDYDFTLEINKVYSKSDYNIAILNDGDLYSWGSNMFNRLGLNQTKKIPQQKIQSENPKTQNSPNTSRETINFLKANNSQEDISFTDRRALNAENSSNSMLKVRIPKKIDIFNKKIAHLALGIYHAVALSQEGQCFSWGNGIYGQLGNNKFGECFPQKISTKHLLPNTFFVSCSAGERHSCLLDQEGNVYTCGTNAYGVLGHQKHENQQKNKRCKIFEKIDFFEENKIKITEITSGDRHILALSESKDVFGWGLNKYNQVILNKKSINYAKEPLNSKEIKQSRVRISHREDFVRKTSRQEHIKPGQLPEKESISESQLIAMKMKEHLNNLPQKFDKDEKISKKLKDWKMRFSQFLSQKRSQQEQFMRELDEIIDLSER